jgi:membrane-associated phospholipid phosphatase
MYWEDIPYHEMTMVQMGDGLGYYGPLLAIACVLMALRNMPQYAILYMVFVFINNLVNRVLKLLFMQDRPSGSIPFSKYEKYTGAEHYGMPSGHASSVAFSWIFLYLLKPHSWWLLITGFIGAMTCIQRWKFKRHSIEQIVAGLCSGGAMAYLVQYIYKKYI